MKMDCLNCKYYCEVSFTPTWDSIKYFLLPSIKNPPMCLLARKPVSDLHFCPNRDGIASSDYVICEKCGKTIPYKESLFKEYKPLLFKWFGLCTNCNQRRNKNDSL